MRKKELKEKGITLIALVITIIVLLILAGVSIATLTGENGILSQAVKAKEKNKKADIIEMSKTDILAYQTKNGNDTITAEQYKAVLNQYFQEVPSIENLEEALKNPEYSLKTKPTYGNCDIKLSDIYAGTVQFTEAASVAYSELTVGDYVSNYPVYYDNVGTAVDIDNETIALFPKDIYNKWRILSIDLDNEVVRLVSAGVPLNYYNSYDSKISVENLTTKFFDIEISSTLTPYKFFKNGFKTTSTVTSTSDLENLFYNDFTDVYKEGETYTDNYNTFSYIEGKPKVQSMTKADVDEVYGSSTSNSTYVEENDLLSLPCYDDTVHPYCNTWLASANSINHLWMVHFAGMISDAHSYGSYGIRVVVSLKPGIKFISNNEKINDTTTWNIAIK